MRWLSRALLALWFALLVLGSLLPRMPATNVVRFPGLMYVAHACAYAVLCVLAAWALKCRSRRALTALAAGAFLLGVVLECVQPLTGRTFDPLDMAANAMGAAFGIGAALLMDRVRRRMAGWAG